ncbi:E3 ubiquitin-protein ligase DZIP3-like [Tribolium madens]|uniref:E3 ubiquitin-protein ligase DZIP3-like n=1 Tax=Tribolium madens TaxID=41895 RepID=UPI001CF740C6|nr:E3 ubiquitin-protein ligase DZIP3-like [Tribolium madens]
MELAILKGPSELLASRVKAFKNCLALATECLSNKDYSHAEMIYGGILADLHKDCIVEVLNLNDLELFSLHICFAYSSVGANYKSEQALTILNSIHDPIKLPLVPYLKAFIHISHDRVSFAHDELQFCNNLLKDGYNFKSNSILNEKIVPEINDEFLKLKINGINFICDLLSVKEDNDELKKCFKDTGLKIGTLCESDFATLIKGTKESPKEEKVTKKTKKQTGAIKKTEKSVQNNKSPFTNMSTQTVSQKGINVSVQTMEKDTDKQLLAAVLEIKNRMNNIQNKKDNEIKQLQKKNSELNVKLLAKSSTVEEKSPEFEFIKGQYLALEKKFEQTQKLNELLQKLLIEQMQQRYQMQKNIYQMFEEKCAYKFSYLSDLYQYLYPSDKPTPEECKQEAFLWKNTQDKLSEAKKLFEAYYKTVDDLIIAKEYSDIKTGDWPGIPNIPNDIQDVIYRSFKSLIQYNKSMYSVTHPQQYLAAMNNYGNFKEYVRKSNNYANNYNMCNQDGRTTGSPSYSQTPPPPPPSTNRYHPPPSTNGYQPQPPIGRKQVSPSRNNSTNVYLPPPSPSTNNSTNVYQSEQELLKFLQVTFDGIEEIELLEAIYQVRDKNGGNLIDFPKQLLVTEIKKVLKMKSVKNAWNNVSQPVWHNDHSEHKCCICFEDFNSSNSHMLSCQHEFHKKCIMNWLKRQSACPVCRVYAVIDKEFPPLKP